MINAKKQENNRIGKTRDLFKKIRDTKGTFHAKMGLIKVRNGMDLKEVARMHRRTVPDNHGGVINLPRARHPDANSSGS